MTPKGDRMFFQQIKEAAPDPIFGLLGAFHRDPRREKINLMVGIYKDNEGNAPVLKSVQRAMGRMEETVADYLPIDGLPELVEVIGLLAFGQLNETIYGAHTPGGTGALRVGAELLIQEGAKGCYVPNQTWPNHFSIFQRAGFEVMEYPYYSFKKKGFDLESVLSFFSKIPKRSILVFHACCHNPTGADPTSTQWHEISKIVKNRELFPFFDFAYQGLGEGITKDREAVEIFLQEGHEMAVAYSCSKNFSMYCQRVGALFVVSEKKKAVESQTKKIIRALYSNPPAHGARLVTEVLKREKGLWSEELDKMRLRLNKMRDLLIDRLSGHMDVEYLQNHKGMFSLMELNKQQVERLIQEFGIYMTDNGRISVAGLTTENVDYVVNSLVKVCAKP